MTVLLMVDPQTEIVDELKQRLLSYYNLSNVDIAIKLIENIPKYEDEYQLDRKHQYITDYFRLQDQAVYVNNIWDINYVADIIASEYIKPKVWFTDDTETARKWVSQLPNLTCWDIETTGLKRPAIEQITMSGFSINHLKAMVFIHTEEIEKLIMEFLTTTDKTIGVHNILFEQRYVYDRTRKFIKNWEDSQLLASAYLNTSPKPLVGLKTLAQYPYKDWASSKESFDLYKDSSTYINENLIYVGKGEYKHYNLPLVYYNGIDVTATHHLLDKYLAIEPEFKSVSIEEVLPIPAPKDHSESIRFFYENVMKPVIKPIVKMLHNGMPIDVSQLPALRTKVESIRAMAYQSFINNELIKPYAEEKMKNDITQFLNVPSLKGFIEVLPEQCPIKEYKNVIAINQYIFESVFVCQINKKPFTLKEMKEFTDKPQILEDILNKAKLHQYADQLEEFVKAYQIEWAKKQNSIHNRLDKINNPMKYIYEDGQIINPQSSNQMGALWNSLGIHSPVMTDGGAESFNMKVIEEFSKSHPEDNIRYAMKDILSIAEGRNLISQYLPRYEQSSYGNKIAHVLKFPGTLSFRLSGGGDSLDKDHPDKYRCGINGVTQPASTSKYFKEVKELFKSTDPEWLIYQIDYEGLTYTRPYME